MSEEVVKEGVPEIINRYIDFVEKQQIDKAHLRDIVNSIVYLDYRCDYTKANHISLDIDKLVSYENKDLLGAWGIKPLPRVSPMPDVQIMRIMVDSLIIALELSVTDKIHYANITSHKLRGNSGAVKDYADLNECIAVLNEIMPSEEESEYGETFQFISDQLGVLERIDKGNGKKIFSSYSFKDVWLPGKYEAYGFDVSNDCPKRLKAGMEHGYFEDSILCTFITAVLDAFMKKIFVPDNAQMIRKVNMIDKFRLIADKCGDSIPIAMSCVTSNIKSLHIPRYSKESMNACIRRVFNPDVNMQMSKLTLVQLYTIMDVAYPPKKGGMA